MNIHELEAYEILEEREIPDVESVSYLLRHKKSGARVAILSNDDTNKVFYIGFRTPPVDGCGVPHIIEHTVLCGSDKFPLKDPFVELVKGSLNTFLNAMTYPDKTVYPIASYNDKDFANLMDVYLDAVFHPNITKRREIFMQEGWHYELENADAPLTINGVVYNEMKGAYSSPDELLMTEISNSLFPDNTYSCNSGGDPKEIPNLTYETYLDFYHKHYHPSNSYIYLYGDMDVAERLDWMDKAYLGEYDAAEVDSDICEQKAFEETISCTAEYPIASEESEENQTYLSYNRVIGTVLDPVLYQAFSALDYALISAPGAPVRQALIDAGIGEDVYSVYDVERQQPVYSIIAKNANASDEERFLSIIDEELRKLVKDGVNRQSLLASINSEEFRFREADFGQFPKGLLYGLQCLDSWIFDENHPFMKLECLDIYAFLKEHLDDGYFENLIEQYLLKNTHGSAVMVVPKRGAIQEEEDRLTQQLADYKAQLSEQEIADLVEQTARLKAYQEEPSTEEELRKIPLLTREDLKREATPFTNIEETVSGVPVVRHEVAAHGIDYLNLIFDASDIAEEDLGLFSLLGNILGYVDTQQHSFLELSNEINIYTGGINCSVGLYPLLKDADEPKDGDKLKNADKLQDADKLKITFEVSVKVLEENLPKAFELVSEILSDSKYTDHKRLQEIIVQTKAQLQSSLSSAGHVAAATRALAGVSRMSHVQDAFRGIAYYASVAQLEQEIRTQPELVEERIRALVGKFVDKNRLMVSFTADEAAYERAVPEMEKLFAAIPEGNLDGQDACCDRVVTGDDLVIAEKGLKAEDGILTETDEGEILNSNSTDFQKICNDERQRQTDTPHNKLDMIIPHGEGFCDASQIQYVARAGNFAKHGFSYTGTLSILKMILSYDYLWINIRVLGGAYGCMSQFLRTGEAYFVSYRDPNLAKTNEVFEGIPAYLRAFAPDERDMTKYIIGTFGIMDTPLNPEAKGNRSMNAYLTGLTFEQIQQERNEILDATPEDIRALADLVEAVLSDGQLCVVGNENAIRKESALFDHIQGLYQTEVSDEC